MGGWLSSAQSTPLSPQDMEEIRKNVQDLISQNKIVIFSKQTCPYCIEAKRCFDKIKAAYTAIELNNHPHGSVIQDIMLEMTGARSVPRVFIDGKCIGGGNDTSALYKSGELQKLVA